MGDGDKAGGAQGDRGDAQIVGGLSGVPGEIHSEDAQFEGDGHTEARGTEGDTVKRRSLLLSLFAPLLPRPKMGRQYRAIDRLSPILQESDILLATRRMIDSQNVFQARILSEFLKDEAFVGGFRIGDTIRVRRPARFIGGPHA